MHANVEIEFVVLKWKRAIRLFSAFHQKSISLPDGGVTLPRSSTKIGSESAKVADESVSRTRRLATKRRTLPKIDQSKIDHTKMFASHKCFRFLKRINHPSVGCEYFRNLGHFANFCSFRTKVRRSEHHSRPFVNFANFNWKNGRRENNFTKFHSDDVVARNSANWLQPDDEASIFLGFDILYRSIGFYKSGYVFDQKIFARG